MDKSETCSIESEMEGYCMILCDAMDKSETYSIKSEMASSDIMMASCSIDVSEISDQRMSAMNGIMEALTEARALIIGLCGTETGTMADMVEKVTRRADRDNLFDKVIRVSLTRKPDLKKIQGEVAAALGFRMKEWSEAKRAALLRDIMRMEQKILLVLQLQDLSQGLDLCKLGIPLGELHRGCKILLTSTSQDILSNQMHAHKVFSA